MHKLFDKIFANRVREVFDGHQEEYNPDDWKNLRAKMGQKKMGMVIWLPHVAKAASVILFLGLSVFVGNKIMKDETSQNFGKTPESNDINFSKREISSVSNKEENIENSIKMADNQHIVNNNQLTENEQDTSGINKTTQDYLIVLVDSLESVNDSINRFANVGYELEKHHQEIQKMDSSQEISNKPILTEDNFEFEFIENKTKEKGRFGFGLEIASVSNYSSEGNSNGVNVGGGFSASYRISKKISFTTGALIAKQSVNYTGSSGNDKLYAAENLALADRTAENNTLSMIDKNTAESEISFVAIDIPMNVQFKHKRISITTGLSSLLYVQEKYS